MIETWLQESQVPCLFGTLVLHGGDREGVTQSLPGRIQDPSLEGSCTLHLLSARAGERVDIGEECPVFMIVWLPGKLCLHFRQLQG